MAVLSSSRTNPPCNVLFQRFQMAAALTITAWRHILIGNRQFQRFIPARGRRQGGSGPPAPELNGFRPCSAPACALSNTISGNAGLTAFQLPDCVYNAIVYCTHPEVVVVMITGLHIRNYDVHCSSGTLIQAGKSSENYPAAGSYVKAPRRNGHNQDIVEAALSHGVDITPRKHLFRAFCFCKPVTLSGGDRRLKLLSNKPKTSVPGIMLLPSSAGSYVPGSRGRTQPQTPRQARRSCKTKRSIGR